MTPADLIAAYDRDASELCEAYDAVDPAILFAPVRAWVPIGSCRVADIGAGTRRDAAWLAGYGHRVTAVEPAAALRRFGARRHRHAPIDWVDDALPDLPRLAAEQRRFELIVLNGVWHHLSATDRTTALAMLRTLLVPSGTMLLRVRAGPTAPGRPAFDLPLAHTIASAENLGLKVAAALPVAAYWAPKRAAGVTWTWLVLHAG
jgi:SAM-dependent methyltransferase